MSRQNKVVTFIHTISKNRTTVTGVTGRRFGAAEKSNPTRVAMAMSCAKE